MTVFIAILSIIILAEAGLIVTLFAAVEHDGKYIAELETELDILLKELECLTSDAQGGGGPKS